MLTRLKPVLAGRTAAFPNYLCEAGLGKRDEVRPRQTNEVDDRSPGLRDTPQDELPAGFFLQDRPAERQGGFEERLSGRGIRGATSAA